MLLIQSQNFSYRNLLRFQFITLYFVITLTSGSGEVLFRFGATETELIEEFMEGISDGCVKIHTFSFWQEIWRISILSNVFGEFLNFSLEVLVDTSISKIKYFSGFNPVIHDTSKSVMDASTRRNLSNTQQKS